MMGRYQIGRARFHFGPFQLEPYFTLARILPANLHCGILAEG